MPYVYVPEKKVRKQCEVCKKAITGTRRIRYCSGACRQRAYRKSKA